jgi:hypothetical protein
LSQTITERADEVEEAAIKLFKTIETLEETVPSRTNFRLSVAGIISESPDTICSICVEQSLTEDADLAFFFSCRHVFCTNCIFRWLQEKT